MFDKATLALMGRIIRVHYWANIGVVMAIGLPIGAWLVTVFGDSMDRSEPSLLTVMLIASALLIVRTGGELFSHANKVKRLFHEGDETIGVVDRISWGKYVPFRYRYVYAGKTYEQNEDLTLFAQAYELSKAIHKENFYIKLLVDPTDPQIAIIPSLYTSTGKDRLEFVNPVSFEIVANLMSSNSRRSNPTIYTVLNTDKRSYIDKLRNHTR